MIVITLIAYLAKSMIFNPYTLYINGILVSQYDMKFEFGVFNLAPLSSFLEKNDFIEEYTNAYKSYIKKFTRAFLQYTFTIVNIHSQGYFP